MPEKGRVCSSSTNVHNTTSAISAISPITQVCPKCTHRPNTWHRIADVHQDQMKVHPPPTNLLRNSESCLGNTQYYTQRQSCQLEGGLPWHGGGSCDTLIPWLPQLLPTELNPFVGCAHKSFLCVRLSVRASTFAPARVNSCGGKQ